MFIGNHSNARIREALKDEDRSKRTLRFMLRCLRVYHNKNKKLIKLTEEIERLKNVAARPS
jgi:hypothetical protein